MNENEIKEAEHIGAQLIQTITDLKKLNKKQIEYLELKFKIAFDKDKLNKLVNNNSK